MRVQLHPIALLCLLSLVALSACVSQDVEVQASDLTVQWCPGSGEVIWSLEFGDDPGAQDPVAWPGDYGYSIRGERSGAGGGGGSSHGRGGRLEPGSRWRLSNTVDLGSRPHSLRVTIGRDTEPSPTGSMGPMDVRFELSIPSTPTGSRCVFMDARVADDLEQ